MNRCEFVGRLVKDPEMRVTQSGEGIVRFTLAVDRIRKSEGQPEADFPTCIAFGKTAEFMDKYIKKGYLVSVEGRLQTGSYDNKQGQKVYTTDIICDSVQSLTPRNANEQPKQEQQASVPDYNENLNISSDDLPF